MYRWQTIAMARAQALAGIGDTREQMGAIRGLLLDIGLSHFPDPSVSIPPQPASSGPAALELRWRVDDRDLQVMVHANGRMAITEIDAEGISQGGEESPNRDRIARLVRWLLFAEPVDQDSPDYRGFLGDAHWAEAVGR